jgi:uncharacterized membrane protein YbhN (UPF0104 family)
MNPGELDGPAVRMHSVIGWREVRARWARPSRPFWRWVRLGGGAAILALLVLRLGAGPFIDGVRRVNVASVVAVIAITAVTTVVSAWRWRLIAGGLGLRIPLSSAVASYYRSQFLNSTLPGGVLGDVHRGVRQGGDGGNVSRGLRSVLWDRAAGQVVQVLLAAVTLLVFASPVRSAVTIIVEVSVVAAVVAVLAFIAIPRFGGAWAARVARTVRDAVRAGVLTAQAGPSIALASVVVVAGHAGVFLVATRATGSPVPTGRLLPLAMLVLLSMTVPTSIGGWGPREGVAAWAFAAAGLGAARGVETATTYGVLSLIATLPGAVVLFAARRRRPSEPTVQPYVDGPVGALVGSGSGRGSDG